MRSTESHRVDHGIWIVLLQWNGTLYPHTFALGRALASQSGMMAAGNRVRVSWMQTGYAFALRLCDLVALARQPREYRCFRGT